MLKTLVAILALPEALGTHACEECGHPQMRCLPDGVFHCPACHAEVTPIV
jgi:ribosomal protein L37AE/L43A